MVDDVHHRLSENLAVSAVRLVDVDRRVFTVGAVDDTVVDARDDRGLVERVANAVGFHQLEFGFALGVTDLGGEGVTVTDHAAEQDGLGLVERETVRDVDALGTLCEVGFVDFLHLRGRRVALGLDAIAHGVEHHVVQNLFEQATVPLRPTALANHRHAVPRRQVLA